MKPTICNSARCRLAGIIAIAAVIGLLMAGCDNGSPASPPPPPPTFTVTFDSAGGSAVDQITGVAHGATITAPTNPTRADYAFQHWYQSDPAEPFVFSTPITASITLRAHWEAAVTFAVTFNTHDGTPIPPVQNVADGGFATRPATDPTRDGYNFTNWYTEEIGGAVFAFATTPITEATTVHARWIAVHTLTFNSAGGTAVEAQNVADGQTASEPTPPTRADHAFQHWYLSDPAEPFVFSTPITASITLRAHWEAAVTFAVTFNTHGGDPVPAAQNVVEGEFAARPATDPTRDGYNFTDWYTEEIGGEMFAFATTAINANTVVHARWQADSGVSTFTVTFDSAGGTAVEAQEVADGQTASEPTPPTRAFTPGAGLWANPLPTDYTFNHWSAPGETGPFAFTTTPVTANITLTAQWTAPTATPVAGVAANNVAAAVTHANANGGHFTLLLDADVTVGAQQEIAAGAHLTIAGIGGRREIRRVGNGPLFLLLGTAANRSLTLGNDITLRGHLENTHTLVAVLGGELFMEEGAWITGNRSTSQGQDGAVTIAGVNASFTMRGGEIFGNTASAATQVAGGVLIFQGALQIVNGYIAGSDSEPEARRNTNGGANGAALLINPGGGGTAGHGRFDGPGGAW